MSKNHSMRNQIWASLRLALPLILANLSSGLMNIVDNSIAGHHSVVTLAAVSFSAAVFWIPMLFCMGCLVASTVLIAQSHGAQEVGAIAPIFHQALWLALLMGAAMFGFLTLVIAYLPLLPLPPPEQVAAADFMGIMRWAAPGLTIFFCMRYLSEGVHWTLPTMLLGFGGLLILAPLGYALTQGRWGFRPHGAQGIAIASTTMVWAQVLCFAGYLRISRRWVPYALFSHWHRPDIHKMLHILRTGLPIGLSLFMEGGIFLVFSLLMLRFGRVSVDAHQIALSVAQICFMIPVGVAEATTIRVGHAIGSKDLPAVRQAALAGCLIVIISQILIGGMLVLCRDLAVAMYTNDVQVIALASDLLLLVSAFQIPDGIQVVCAGALRGMRDTRIPMLLAMVSYWCIGFPLALCCGFYLHWGPEGMWFGLVIGLTVASILLASRLYMRSGSFKRPPAAGI